MERAIEQVLPARPATDGEGVRLKRVLAPRFAQIDPFLMLDEIQVDAGDQVGGGFPPHPHRGFETLTYLLTGEIAHRDHLGNEGQVGPGGLQWMHAGRGIVHEEMPRAGAEGFRGFQLWLNLPAARKMTPPAYRDVAAGEVVEVVSPEARVRVLAGTLVYGGQSLTGPLQEAAQDLLYADLSLAPGAELRLPVAADKRVLLHVYQGSQSSPTLEAGTLAVLGDGDGVRLQAGQDGLGVLLLAATPIHEPVVQHGPFVMNSREEIEQALRDYRDGHLTDA